MGAWSFSDFVDCAWIQDSNGFEMSAFVLVCILLESSSKRCGKNLQKLQTFPNPMDSMDFNGFQWDVRILKPPRHVVVTAGHENLGYPQSPMETGVLHDMLRGWKSAPKIC